MRLTFLKINIIVVVFSFITGIMGISVVHQPLIFLPALVALSLVLHAIKWKQDEYYEQKDNKAKREYAKKTEAKSEPPF